MTNLSIRMRELRKEKNLSQAELGKIVDAKQSCISKWERKENIPPIMKVIDMAKYFNVSIDFFMGRTDTRKEFGKAKKYLE